MTTATAEQPLQIQPLTPNERRPASRGPGFIGRSWVLARRELFSYFVSPIAYVAMFLFLIASGFSSRFASRLETTMICESA